MGADYMCPWPACQEYGRRVRRFTANPKCSRCKRTMAFALGRGRS